MLYCYLVTCDMIKHHRCLFEVFLEVNLITHDACMFYITTLCTVDNSAEMRTFKMSAIEPYFNTMKGANLHSLLKQRHNCHSPLGQHKFNNKQE